MLSPGVMFPSGYLLLYLSTNIYLNGDFKKNLSQSVQKATGNTWHISIKSLQSGLVLDSVILNNIELTKATTPENRADTSSTITINTLEIPLPNLQQLLFNSSERLTSTNALCDKILAEKNLAQ